MHELIACLVQKGPKKNPIPNMARGIHRFSPISPRSPMLVEHRPSHLTKGTIFPLNHAILTSHIRRRELMFETQITTKGFEMRVFKFNAIVLRIARTTSPFLSFLTYPDLDSKELESRSINRWPLPRILAHATSSLFHGRAIAQIRRPRTCQRCVGICEKGLVLCVIRFRVQGSLRLQETCSFFFHTTPALQNIPLPRRRNSDFVAVLYLTACLRFCKKDPPHQ
jgi:hypothetical protein